MAAVLLVLTLVIVRIIMQGICYPWFLELLPCSKHGSSLHLILPKKAKEEDSHPIFQMRQWGDHLINSGAGI